MRHPAPTWDAADHPRDAAGRWTESAGHPPERDLAAQKPSTALAADYRRAPIPAGAALTIDDEGEDQDCSCGNSTWSNWWASGGSDGTVTMDAVGSGDDETTIICPNCGLVFRLGDTELGSSTPPIGRFDTTDDRFRDALDHQHRMLFGSPRRPDNVLST